MRNSLLVAALAVAAMFAGCSDDGPTRGVEPPCAVGQTCTTLPPPPPPPEGKALIHGIVVDESVTPLAGVEISAVLADHAPLVANTDDRGIFLFQGVDPGTYTLEARRLGYDTIQQSVTAVADEAEPDLVQIQLKVDPATRPYSEGPVIWDGFVECGASTPAGDLAVCFVASEFGVGEDNTQKHYAVERVPTLSQSELVWDSTQATGAEMSLVYSWDDCGEFLCDHGATGTSPVIVRVNQTMGETMVAVAPEFWLRVFGSDMSETAPPPGTCIPPNPIVTGCPQGVGATWSQAFQVYTTNFYGYQPPADWTFYEAHAVPAPMP